MPRPPAPTRLPLLTRDGERRTQGIDIRESDLARVRLLARWYCLTTKQIAAFETAPAEWHPMYPAVAQLSPEERARRLSKPAESARRRLAKLARIEKGYGDGPLVAVTYHDAFTPVYSATRRGGQVADTPWDAIGEVSWNNIAHATLAANVGLQLEAMLADAPGWAVYTQRELDTGHAANGDDLPNQYRSTFQGRNGETTQKNPDLVLSKGDGSKYVAIEIERDRNRPMSVYRSKLQAYEQNPDILAVWYVCEHSATANRVAEAAKDYPGANVRVLSVIDLGNGITEADIRYTQFPEEQQTYFAGLIGNDIQQVISA